MVSSSIFRRGPILVASVKVTKKRGALKRQDLLFRNGQKGNDRGVLLFISSYFSMATRELKVVMKRTEAFSVYTSTMRGSKVHLCPHGFNLSSSSRVNRTKPRYLD